MGSWMRRGCRGGLFGGMLCNRFRMAEILSRVQDGGMTNYRVVLGKSEEGYSVSCPGLPGCWSQGETEAEALANIQIAIREYVEAAEELARDADTRVVEVAIA